MLHSHAVLLNEKTCPKYWYPKTLNFLKAYCSVVLVLTEIKTSPTFKYIYIYIYIDGNHFVHVSAYSTSLKSVTLFFKTLYNSITESAQAFIGLLEKQLNEIDGD